MDDDEWDVVEDDGVLDASDTLDDDRIKDPLDVGIVASDRWNGANRFGTTRAEALLGESLDDRLAEEEPDVWDSADDDSTPRKVDEDEMTRHGYEREQRAGRLYAEDEGIGPDVEPDAVAFDAGIDAGAASAEEAAVHMVDEENDANSPFD